MATGAGRWLVGAMALLGVAFVLFLVSRRDGLEPATPPSTSTTSLLQHSPTIPEPTPPTLALHVRQGEIGPLPKFGRENWGKRRFLEPISDASSEAKAAALDHGAAAITLVGRIEGTDLEVYRWVSAASESCLAVFGGDEPHVVCDPALRGGGLLLVAPEGDRVLVAWGVPDDTAAVVLNPWDDRRWWQRPVAGTVAFWFNRRYVPSAWLSAHTSGNTVIGGEPLDLRAATGVTCELTTEGWVEPGPLVRPVVINATLNLLDPISGVWQTDITHVGEFGFRFVVQDSDVWERSADNELVELRTGRRLLLNLPSMPTTGTFLSDPIGAIDDTLLIPIGREVTDGIATAIHTGVVAFDPTTGSAVWEWLGFTPDLDEDYVDEATLHAKEALTNPSGDRAVVGLAMVEQAPSFSQPALIDAHGRQLYPWHESWLGEGPIKVFGWIDDRRLLAAPAKSYSPDRYGHPFVFDTDTGHVLEVNLDGVPWRQFLLVKPVGDSRSVLVNYHDELTLWDIETGELSSPLASGCDYLIANPGWG